MIDKLKEWLLPKINEDGTLSLGESTKKDKKVIEFIIMPKHIVFGILFFIGLLILFAYSSPVEIQKQVQCVDGTVEDVEENKTVYCGENIGNLTIEEYLGEKIDEQYQIQ